MPAATLGNRRARNAGSLRRAIAVAGLLALGFRVRSDRAADAAHARCDTPAAPARRVWPRFKLIVRQIYEDLSKRRIIAIAAGVTFYALLAVFPAIAAIVALYGLFADPGTIGKHLDLLTSFVPGGAIDVIREQITRIAAQSGGTLGLAVFAGIAISLWSANGGMKALFDALNVVYGVDERRGFVRLNAISLAIVAGAIVFVLLAIGAVVALPVVLNHVGMGSLTRLFASIGRWPALFVAVALMLAVIYRFGPDRPNPVWRWITWGSAAAAVAWLVASVLFSWYAENFGNFNKTYGSLGAVIGFMMWLWISGIVVLMGAEIDSVLERPAATPGNAPRPELQGSS